MLRALEVLSAVLAFVALAGLGLAVALLGGPEGAAWRRWLEEVAPWR